MEEYNVCQTDALELQAGSNYLTEQIRAFTVTGESHYVDLYFREALVDRRREKAIEELEPYALDVSSGIETDGFKDKEKMIRFMKNVRDLRKSE